MKSSELLARYAESKGLAGAAFDGDGHCAFDTKDGLIPVSMETNEDESLIHVCAVLGRLMDDDASLSAVGALMVVNGLFNAEGRGCFALEGDKADRIVLLRLFETERLTVDAFAGEMEEFLADAHEWHQRLQEPDLGLPDENDVQPADGGASFMRA